MGFIYLIYNTITTKIYVGQTIERIEDRIRKHFANETNLELALDYAKYGKDAFEIYKLAECDNSKLNELEKYYIKLYDSFENGYNLTIGGGGKFKIYDEELVLDLYSKGESLISIQEKTGYTWSKVKSILDTRITTDIENMHINNNVSRQKNSKISIIMLNITGDRIEKIFESKIEAYLFICDEQNKVINKQNFYARVSIACTSDRICYKHRWRLSNKVHNTNIISEVEQKYNTEIDVALEKVDVYKGNKSKKPDADTLKSLINECTYEEVGKKYGVTGKAVRKWCDSYGIKRITCKKPDKLQLEELVNNYKVSEIAHIFRVAQSTVSWWIKDLGVRNNKRNIKLKCIETE